MRLFVNQQVKKEKIKEGQQMIENQRKWHMRHHYFSKAVFRVKTAQDKGSKMAYTDLVNVKSCDDFIKRNVKIV